MALRGGTPLLTGAKTLIEWVSLAVGSYCYVIINKRPSESFMRLEIVKKTNACFERLVWHSPTAPAYGLHLQPTVCRAVLFFPLRLSVGAGVCFYLFALGTTRMHVGWFSVYRDSMPWTVEEAGSIVCV